jgi:hypothetical protein
VKKLILAAVLAATTASAQAAVSYTFSGAEYDTGAAVGGTLTLDTDALLAAINQQTDPSLEYYFQTDDSGSTSPTSFLSISFTSTGSQNSVLTGGSYTYQWLLGDVSGGQLGIELDFQALDGFGITHTTQITFSGFDLTGSQNVDGVLLPDFAHSGDVTLGIYTSTGTGPDEVIDGQTYSDVSFATPGVPEASSWTMMVLGFGAVGYAARRRTRVAFAA